MPDELLLIGTTVLERALRREAARHDVPFRQEPRTGTALLGRTGRPDHRVPLVPDAEIPAEVARHAVHRLHGLLRPAPGTIDGTVLVPAAGVCGPAMAGPVDAVRDGGVLDALAGTGLPRCRLRMLTVPHTRCWVLSAAVFPRPADPGPSLPTEQAYGIGPAIAADTARATQYLHDAGRGEDWPDLVFLGEPATAPDGSVRLLVAFTDAGYAASVFDRAFAGARAEASTS